MHYGTLKAAYCNPRPIKVGKAELRRTEGKTVIFVALRDINYPGSQYRLIYDQKTDQLRGTCFQAAGKQTYAVEFVRAE